MTTPELQKLFRNMAVGSAVSAVTFLVAMYVLSVYVKAMSKAA